jgi:ureidoglycolate lyase|tara:strand:- start:1448 stop:1954 length:507 start_codon:yes stop_codon:yes gene_type:complete
MAKTLIPKPLCSSSFAPYGDVIEVKGSTKKTTINHGQTIRYDDLARPDLTDQNGWPVFSIFRSEATHLPLQILFMERHPLGSQTFMPLSEFSYLVAVAPPGELDTSAIELFLAEPGQGVNYHKGTWHHYCLALNSGSEFLVLDRGGNGHNCDEVKIKDGPLLKLEDGT